MERDQRQKTLFPNIRSSKQESPKAGVFTNLLLREADISTHAAAMIDIKQATTSEQLKPFLSALCQLYELNRKVQKRSEFSSLERNIEKMKAAFEEMGYRIEDPQGQSYNETRVDLEASIAGSSTEDLVVTEVIKPIIRYVMRDSGGEYTKVIQRGVVVVETRIKN